MVYWLFFCLQLKKGSRNTKKTRRLSKEEIEHQLIDSIFNNNIIKTDKLNAKADKVEKPENAAAIIKQYEDIIGTKKKNIKSIAYHQGKVFKRLNNKEKFINLVNEFEVYKSTIIFKMIIVKLIDKHPALMKSSVTLGFLKNYHKDIKQICNKSKQVLNR